MFEPHARIALELFFVVGSAKFREVLEALTGSLATSATCLVPVDRLFD